MAANSKHQLPEDLFLDLKRSGPVPLYHQLATRLEGAIRSERLPAGTRIENEVALGMRLGMSRPTVRRAIQELVDKGLLVRRRGIGTQVVHGRVSRKVELTSLYDDLERTGQRPTSRVLVCEVSAATDAHAEALSVAVGAPVLHLLRVRLADGVPIAILENVLSEPFLDLDREQLAARGLYQVLSAHGVTMRIAKQRIGARAATAYDAELLEIAPGDALLTMERTAFDATGRAVEFGTHCYRPDRYSFEITLVER